MTDLPFQPLQLLIEKRGGLAAVGASKGSNPALRQAYYRAKRRGTVPVVMADTLCVELLDCHPREVWGDVWIACVMA